MLPYDETVDAGRLIIDLLFPKTCLGCNKFGLYICKNCRGKLDRLVREETICPVCARPAVGGAVHPRCATRYSPDGLTAIFHYEEKIRKSIHLLKYRKVESLAEELVEIIERYIESSVLFIGVRNFIKLHNPVVTPVPLFKARERKRWFNQSESLGKQLAKRWNLEFYPNILVKTRQTKPQAGLSREERLTNVKGAFTTNPNIQFLTPNAYILVDDVWTTGATMRECVNVLKRGGVKRVWCVTVAR